MLGADLGLESVERDPAPRSSDAGAGLPRRRRRTVRRAAAGSDGVVVPLPAPSGVRGRPMLRPSPQPRADGGDGDRRRHAGCRRPPRPEPSAVARAAQPSARPRRPRSTPTRCGSSPPASSTTTACSCSSHPSLAGLRRAPLRVNPYDFDRLGVADGAEVQVTSPRATLALDLEIEPACPAGARPCTSTSRAAPVASSSTPRHASPTCASSGRTA